MTDGEELTAEISQRSARRPQKIPARAHVYQGSLFGTMPSTSCRLGRAPSLDQAVAPAPPSPLQAKAKGLTTLVTSGRPGIVSSASAALEQSLVSRLMERLDTAGSTLFTETWKRRRTPLGLRYWAHTQRRRTPHPSASLFRRCRLPVSSDMTGGGQARAGDGGQSGLREQQRVRT